MSKKDNTPDPAPRKKNVAKRANSDFDPPLKQKAYTPKELLEEFEEYVQWRDENPLMVEDYVGKDAEKVDRQKKRVLTKEGFEIFLYKKGGAYCLDHYFYNRDGAYESYVGICAFIKKIIKEDQISGAMAGIYHPQITARLQGLVEKVESKNENHNTNHNFELEMDLS